MLPIIIIFKNSTRCRDILFINKILLYIWNWLCLTDQLVFSLSCSILYETHVHAYKFNFITFNSINFDEYFLKCDFVFWEITKLTAIILYNRKIKICSILLINAKINTLITIKVSFFSIFFLYFYFVVTLLWFEFVLTNSTLLNFSIYFFKKSGRILQHLQ